MVRDGLANHGSPYMVGASRESKSMKAGKLAAGLGTLVAQYPRYTKILRKGGETAQACDMA